MFSRLFKFGMVAGGRPPVYPHMATTRGDVFQYDAKTDSFTKLLSLSSSVTNPQQCAYSPDGVFLAFSRSSTPGYNLFKRTSSGYEAVTLPGTTELTYAVEWSPDGNYLFYGAGSGNVLWWKRNADDTFTQLPTTALSNSNTIKSFAVSPDNKYLAVSLASSPFLCFCKLNNDTLVKLTNPSSPGYYALGMAFLDATTLLFPCSNTNTGGTYMYKVDPATDTTTRTTATAITYKNAWSMRMSGDGVHFAIGFYGTAALRQYSYDGTNITELAAPDVQTVGYVYGTAYSPDGNYLAAAESGAPYIGVYKRVGDTLTKIADFAGVSQSSTYDVTFAPAVNV